LLQLKQLDLDARSQEMLKVLEDSARHGADLVKQILTFTRGSEGKRFPVQVADLLTEVTSLVQKTFPKSITVQETLPANPPAMVLADATQLHQVLMNLCVNARDAMPDGGTLSLAVENIEINEIFTHINPDAHVGRYVGITIADTGTGIAPEVRDLIFDPFFTTKPFGQGTGLGLSTVLGIVRSLGGFVEVESQPGAGSQFKVYLSALKTEVLTSQHEATLPQGQGELILVVDDEEAILQSTQEVLET
jgi:signal transduction histidine kinase